jgi:hypothetical protein
LGKSEKPEGKKTSKRKRLMEMYDNLVSNLLAKDVVIEPNVNLDNSRISIGYSSLASENSISKYYIITNLPDYLDSQLLDIIRYRCIKAGVKINFYMFEQPHTIKWNSAEMRNKISIWKDYTDKAEESSVFDYRVKRKEGLARQRIIWSTKYLNEAELDYKRTLMKVSIVVRVSAQRNMESIINMMDTIASFKGLCINSDIKFKELRVNLIDWLQSICAFSLRYVREVETRMPKKVVTDDIMANFNGYKQGLVGRKGMPLGIDVESGQAVLYQMKSDPDAAENWLVSASTGGGKSYFVKDKLPYMLASGYVVTIMDYEGDEYSKFAYYIADANPDDVQIVSMGKGSLVYFDPMPIQDLTGDEDIDRELKENAVNYTFAIFRLLVAGLEGNLTQWQENIISNAIRRVYESVGVTDEKRTWVRSKVLQIRDVYDEIVELIASGDLRDETTDNALHAAAVEIQMACKIYFEEGESKSGTFKNPLSADDLYKARLIIFSFGLRGAAASTTDPVILALKQLSVANLSTQISNYCRYVRHCFNVKVWEEYQRWGDAKGSAEIISNAMTGGRKRGDINFIITNALASLLDDSNKLTRSLKDNIQCYAIGKTPDVETRQQFCEKFHFEEIMPALDRIADESADEEGDGASPNKPWNKAFCVCLQNGKKAIVKVDLPPSIHQSGLFKSVELQNANKIPGEMDNAK